MATIGSLGTEVYQATLEEMAELSRETAEQIAATDKRYENLVASANGGLFLALCIGQALGIDIQTMRVEQFELGDPNGTIIPVIRPLDIRKANEDSTLFATNLLDSSSKLFAGAYPGADIATNYATLDTRGEANYCGKVVLPKQAGNEVLIQFWYDLAQRI